MVDAVEERSDRVVSFHPYAVDVGDLVVEPGRADPRTSRAGCGSWATRWESEANQCLASLLGVPELPAVTWPDTSDEDERGAPHWTDKQRTSAGRMRQLRRTAVRKLLPGVLLVEGGKPDTRERFVRDGVYSSGWRGWWQPPFQWEADGRQTASDRRRVPRVSGVPHVRSSEDCRLWPTPSSPDARRWSHPGSGEGRGRRHLGARQQDPSRLWMRLRTSKGPTARGRILGALRRRAR